MGMQHSFIKDIDNGIGLEAISGY